MAGIYVVFFFKTTGTVLVGRYVFFVFLLSRLGWTRVKKGYSLYNANVTEWNELKTCLVYPPTHSYSNGRARNNCYVQSIYKYGKTAFTPTSFKCLLFCF